MGSNAFHKWLLAVESVENWPGFRKAIRGIYRQTMRAFWDGGLTTQDAIVLIRGIDRNIVRLTLDAAHAGVNTIAYDRSEN